MAYEIEKDVPRELPGNIKYPLRQMEIGDSFFVPNKDKFRAGNVHSTAQRIGIKIVTRKIEGGWRVWRVE